MSDDDLKAIAARNAARTPGVWWAEREAVHSNSGLVAACWGTAEAWKEASNAAFIAHASKDVPLLLGEVAFLRGLLADAAGIDGAPVQELERLKKDCASMRAALEWIADSLARARTPEDGLALRGPVRGVAVKAVQGVKRD